MKVLLQYFIFIHHLHAIVLFIHQIIIELSPLLPDKLKYTIIHTCINVCPHLYIYKPV